MEHRTRGAQDTRRRAGHAQDDHILDPYKRPQKLAEPMVCPQRGAVYQAGRWHWVARPKSAHEVVCQACHRINDRYPAGVVTLSGALTAQQKVDMINLARHQEAAEKRSILSTASSISKRVCIRSLSTPRISISRAALAKRSRARFTASSRGISTNMGISFV